MKKSLLIASIVSAFFVANASSQAAEVGILDVEKIVKESTAMRDIQKKISAKQDEYQKEVDKKQKELEKEQKAIESKKSALSQEAFDAKTKDFQKKIDDLKTYVDKKQNILKKASIDGMGKVNDEIKEIIADLVKEKGYTVVVPASQTLYYQDDLDISDEVLKRLNKKVTKVKVSFE